MKKENEYKESDISMSVHLFLVAGLTNAREGFKKLSFLVTKLKYLQYHE